MKTMETNRVLRFFETEMRASSDAKMEVQGYALKFNKVTHISSKKWGFKEKIASTACNDADFSDVIFNFNHSVNALLAGVRNKSLDLAVDKTGLHITARIADTAVGRDVYTLIKDGLICRMSWWAVIRTSEWKDADDDDPESTDERTITGFGKFFDVSAVTFPAYEDTEIETRGSEAAVRSWAAEKEQREKQIYDRQMRRMEKILSAANEP